MSKLYIPARLFLICLMIGFAMMQVSVVTSAQTDSDGDGRPDSMDECPNTPGTVRGCPDSDGDGFHDREDDCPNVAGTVRGCVDTDGDGRPDVADDCPTVPGTVRGCPDGDGDGFHDREDECPDVSGALRGCPDLDGDGFHVLEDECPNEFGTVRGCPDADGDGRADIVDDCPNTPGAVRGCPDSDGDGFHDREDECPNVAGTVRGCVDTDGDGRPDVVDDCPTIPGDIRGCPATNTPSPVEPVTNPNPTEQPTATPTPEITIINTNSVVNQPCALTPNGEASVVLYQAPSTDSTALGVFDPQADYIIYGIKAPDNWFWLDIGWIEGRLVGLTGDCGGLVGYDIPLTSDTATTIAFADVDLADAQIECTFLPELGAPFCFYHLFLSPEDTQPAICITQNNVLNCEIGGGVFSVLFSQIFTSETPTEEADAEPVTETPSITACTDLMTNLLSPYFETNDTVSFRVVNNYLVGFIPQADFGTVVPQPCQNEIAYLVPRVENGEVQPDFAVQTLTTSYQAWLSDGWEDLSLDEKGFPLVALLLPDIQKGLAKQEALATTPIQIDFLNQMILFGDGSVFFSFDSASFSQQVLMLTGLDFSASSE